MITGDPRGHEPAWTRKPRKKPDDERPPKEPPFRFVADFEWIEGLFGW